MRRPHRAPSPGSSGPAGSWDSTSPPSCDAAARRSGRRTVPWADEDASIRVLTASRRGLRSGATWPPVECRRGAPGPASSRPGRRSWPPRCGSSSGWPQRSRRPSARGRTASSSWRPRPAGSMRGRLALPSTSGPSRILSWRTAGRSSPWRATPPPSPSAPASAWCSAGSPTSTAPARGSASRRACSPSSASPTRPAAHCPCSSPSTRSGTTCMPVTPREWSCAPSPAPARNPRVPSSSRSSPPADPSPSATSSRRHGGSSTGRCGRFPSAACPPVRCSTCGWSPGCGRRSTRSRRPRSLRAWRSTSADVRARVVAGGALDG